ncbi:hypothetical protein K2173_008436 [Erythroxylum novogranatense]|uniref:Uncharacterized protein n=1 Tax=Erythroxylum novogranatense TaxID=1862640 RepID=A0AAV8U921_9ROSI|nr:hypothetical protein K2173_008436 [Erythroxylum novogranatense]
MKGNVNDSYDYLNFTPFSQSGPYYQDSVTVTSKGLKMDLVKILTVFISVDFSSNYFEGPIPEVIGQFKGLHILNLSHNALNGSIPSTFGNLSQLESLDLSFNNLTGSIPQQLAGLTFLSFLNLSHNKLVGMIPTSTQLQSFLPSCFEGNAGLCGPPLSESCRDGEHEDTHLSSEIDSVNVSILSVEIGYIFGLVVIIGPLVYCKRCRLWYYRKVDYYLFIIFPRLEEANRRTRGRRGQSVRRRRN